MGRSHANLHIKLRYDEKGTDDDCFLFDFKCLQMCEFTLLLIFAYFQRIYT